VKIFGSAYSARAPHRRRKADEAMIV